MASTIAAVTTGGGGVITTADSSGNLSLLSGVNTVVAVTSAGATVTGTLAATGASTFTGTGKFATTIGVGNATPSASGSGITFPATQSASSNTNTLDDYEEGTWTPTQNTLTVVGTFSSAGTYTKIGRMVFFVGYVAGSTSVAAIAGAAFEGLPFLGSERGGGGTGTNAAVTASADLYVGPGDDAAFIIGGFAATTNFTFSGSYFAAT